MTYADRRQAGDALATHLTAHAGRPDVVVLGLVRGGVPVAARVAAALDAPLDVLVVRKLGVPWAPRGRLRRASGPNGVVVHNPEVESHLSAAEMKEVVEAETEEVARREELYRRGRPPLALAGRVAIIVDDGLATGATARAAAAVARRLGRGHRHRRRTGRRARLGRAAAVGGRRGGLPARTRALRCGEPVLRVVPADHRRRGHARPLLSVRRREPR